MATCKPKTKFGWNLEPVPPAFGVQRLPESPLAGRGRICGMGVVDVEPAMPSGSDMPAVLSPSEEPPQLTWKQEMILRWKAAIKNCVLFNGLPEAECKFILKASKMIETFAGTVIYSQQDAPSMLYLVHSGTFLATVSTAGFPVRLREYGLGCNFGACELLCQMGGRSCTMTCVADGLLWAIPKRVVTMKLKSGPPLPSGLVAFCRTVPLVSSLPNERLQQLCRGALPLSLNAGETLFEEEDPAHDIYALQSGALQIESVSQDFTLTMDVPGAFGETALFGDGEHRVRRATVRAAEGGASILRWSVAEIETLVGYALQSASMREDTPTTLKSSPSDGLPCGRVLG